MIDMILEWLLFLVIMMVDAVTIHLIIVTIENETIPSSLDEITIFELMVWSIRIAWVIILIVLNVVVLVDTYNDLYFPLANDIIESGAFTKE